MTAQTVLLRQVHPDFIPAGGLTSQAFMPFPKDEGKPSVYDGDQITPADSHQHYTEVLGLRSHSVWGVSCAEVTESGLSSRPDPKQDFPSHALIDFTAHRENSFRKLAKKLKAKALARGCLHPPGIVRTGGLPHRRHFHGQDGPPGQRRAKARQDDGIRPSTECIQPGFRPRQDVHSVNS